MHLDENGVSTIECQNERLQLNLRLRRPFQAVGNETGETVFVSKKTEGTDNFTVSMEVLWYDHKCEKYGFNN